MLNSFTQKRVGKLSLMLTNQTISDLYFADSLVTLLLVARLWHLRLHKRLPWFVSFLVLDLVVGYSGLAAGFSSRTYCVIFAISEPLFLLILVFMTREVFSRLHSIYPACGYSRAGCFMAVWPGEFCVLVSEYRLRTGAGIAPD